MTDTPDSGNAPSADPSTTPGWFMPPEFPPNGLSTLNLGLTPLGADWGQTAPAAAPPAPAPSSGLMTYSKYADGSSGGPAPVMPGASVASAPAIATPGAPAGYANRVAGYESGGNPNAENPNYPVAKGGPAGPHQFLASTWNDFAKANPDLFTGMSPDQILAARTNPVMSQKATEWYAQQNAPILQKAGILPTPANLAIAHSFGGTGAAGLLGFPDSTPLTKVFKETQPGMADAILKANPQYTTMTVGDIKSKYAAMDGGQYQPAAAPPTTAPAQQAMARPQNNLMMQDNPFLRLAMFSQLSNLFKSQGQNVQQTNNNLLQALAAAGRTSQAAAYDRPINV